MYVRIGDDGAGYLILVIITYAKKNHSHALSTLNDLLRKLTSASSFCATKRVSTYTSPTSEEQYVLNALGGVALSS